MYFDQILDQEWHQLLAQKKFDFWKEPKQKERVVYSFHNKTFNSSHKTRTAAWLLVLHIDLEEKDSPIRDFYKRKIENLSQIEETQVVRDIKKDVVRTGAGKYRDQKMETGENSLFNVLFVYSQYNKRLGYTQGLNFIVDLLLEVTRDEFTSFMILKELLKIDKWATLYTEGTPRLFYLSKLFKEKLKKNSVVYQHIYKKEKILMEPLMASVFMTLFSNIVD